MDKQSLIAVVGMAGIFPGALDLDAFWHNIVNGVDQSAPVPENRWIAPPSDRLRTTLAADHPYSRHACLINDFVFDPGSFSLDPHVTRGLDPVHQLTLTAGKRAIDGCITTAVDPHRVDTILAAIALPTDGASAFSRQTLGKAIEDRLFPRAKGSAAAVTRVEALASRVDGLPAALLAAEMGYGGDSFTLDAACASSIYALKLACNALAAHRADMVVTGGVSRPECLYTQTGFSQLQALSPSGRCAPFDHRADGLVVGEGVGILVLKRLDDAIAHGDAIHGVIHGIGLSNDMRGNLLAPESRGQVRAMQAAYRTAGWQPSDVDHIECHGTGTRAGDTTEIESLIQLWENTPADTGACAIGSVKSMIGHLLTAAGAAGMIKTLLAMRHQTLPPAINFDKAPENSPLEGSPFLVQTRAAPWKPRAADRPRRAAVSAFGFGGINAHVLFEQWPLPTAPAGSLSGAITVGEPPEAPAPVPVAIVGMGVALGALNQLKYFEKAVFQGRSAIAARPPGRWKGTDAAVVDALGGFDPQGAYIDHLSLGIGEFQIPPNEFNDILPQQLLALKVGADALTDAGLSLRESRERMGVVVGIGFDFEATNYHLRWQLYTAVRRWNRIHGLHLDETDMDAWLERLRDDCGPPLTPPRVVGALGGIVASRMAREFRFGGPSFVVAGDAASGIKALQAAVDLLRLNEADAMLVGAVDLAGEGRNVVRMDRLYPFSRTQAVRPFDTRSDGTLPGDGAVALVLKRLDRAIADSDRIYAVIRGIGSAGGDDPTQGGVGESTYRRSLGRCFDRTDVNPGSVSYMEAHGAGIPDRDAMELGALDSYFSKHGSDDPSAAIALGSTKPISGYSGAADGLVSLAKTALCLHHRILPPLVGHRQPVALPVSMNRFHLPDRAQPWYRDRDKGPRTACCASITMDGSCSHVLLQDHENPAAPVDQPDAAPVMDVRTGLFVVTGETPAQLIDALAGLDTLLSRPHAPWSVETSAADWMKTHPPQPDHRLAVALVLKSVDQPDRVLDEARQAIESGSSATLSTQVFYQSAPIGANARIAMVYPGSGNHYLGMGRNLALRFPGVVDAMDRGTAQLKTQFRPWHLMPWRQSWQPGWEANAASRLKADPLNMIFGQVVFGDLMTRVLDRFSISSDAVIGYSLGESAGLFAQGVWSDRGEMLKRMQDTDLFTTQLSGPCKALRRAWDLPDDPPVAWRVAVVNRPAAQVRETLAGIPRVRLLIVNTPDECVIGGLEPAVEKAIAAMRCQAVYLDGVVTVHCDAARPVADAYRRLHWFPATEKPGLTVYSCSWAAPYAVTSDRIADSIEKQAVDGFDFTHTIKRAAADGINVFIEAGPRGSCTRMINQILAGQPHLAVSANRGNADEIASLLRCLARLAAARVPMDLGALYAGMETPAKPLSVRGPQRVMVAVGGHPPRPTLPQPGVAKKPVEPLQTAPEPCEAVPAAAPVSPPPAESEPVAEPNQLSNSPLADLLDAARQNMETTASAHQQFLELSSELTQAFADTFDLQNRLLGLGARVKGDDPQPPPAAAAGWITSDAPVPPVPVAFDRDMCMQFAVGSVGRMLGPAFEVVDTHRVRVRLPDEPLMLVDRIISVEGEMLSMGSGRVVTEHDVLAGAWYLDGDRAPVCISVEAGQADLFLSSYLGIDHQVKGERAYRLLDAVVVFHRGLPRPGDTIRYEIAIDRFVRQGATWMFFFRFEGYIGSEHLITMRDGCAGFFTDAEVRNSGGIILTEEERKPIAGKSPADWRPPVPMARESYSDDQLDALRRGDLAGCFGEAFAGMGLATSLALPDGRMRLIHRILAMDPDGGRYGLGMIRAEADIHPDDWFLVCHFVDDMVMPGTLMYECCAHTLRVFLQRMGWVTDKPGVCYEPVIGNGAQLKCRGPVTPATRHVHYEIQISQIGYGPEPYAIADAHMFADGRPIVFFKDMSMRMTGISREEIETGWRQSHNRTAVIHRPAPPARPLYDRVSILAYSVGNPSEAFGEPYRIFDRDRKIARLPGPPYCFMDRVVHVEPEPWVLAAGGWVTAEYDIPEKEWYFAADRSGVMPFGVLLEIALQPCGWLAAYAGSALRSGRDLKFRNLGGTAVLHRQVTPGTGTLTMRCRLTKVSEAADMIIENFAFQVLAGDEMVYDGDTYFGFFSAEALNEQKGLGGADPMVKSMAAWSGRSDGAHRLSMDPPHTPDAAAARAAGIDRLMLPAKALLMIDGIDAYVADGGADGLGYIRGTKQVDPDEWFFKAHFYQDPVCPGSLGLESFLQLIKTVAMKRWPHLAPSHRFRMVEGSRHGWSYRGQIIPKNSTVVVEALVTRILDGPSPTIRADGLLSVDGLPIYKMENFELALIPAADSL